MPVKHTFILAHDSARALACKYVMDAPEGWMVTISERTRTGEQNSAQWPYLEGFAEQRELCINGRMEKVTKDDWKDVLTACYQGEVRMAMFDGKVIMLPCRTSTMGKSVFSSWMEFLVAMAAQSGVEPIYRSAMREPA